MAPPLWRLLQTTDSLFPTGAFSHSGGLEGLVVDGVLSGADDGERAIEEILFRCFARIDLPACGLAHRAAAEGDVARLIEIDAGMDSLKAPRELRDAGRSLGRRRLKVVAAPDAYRRAVEENRSPGQQAVVTGIHAALEGISREEALLAYAFGTASGLVAAAMKLLPLGQTRAQAFLSKLGEDLPARVRSADDIALEDLGAFTPVLDIAAMRHETARTRLFIS
ncbi:MAG TPA: urease accessory UreF family protein [Planctomycetota bacterium]|nr:urease accessory UreF family protein [Planctomycetota bacterium]